MAETAPISEGPRPEISPFDSLRKNFGAAARQIRGIESGNEAEMRAAVHDPEVWKKTFQRLAVPGESVDTCHQNYCRELAQTAVQLGASNEQVQSFESFLGLPEGKIDYYSAFMDATSWQKAATGGTPGGVERKAEPVDLFQAHPPETGEKLPRYRDRDEQIAYRTYQEAWNPNPLMANRVDNWFENERARLRARGEVGQSSEKREVRPPLRWLLDEINTSLKDRNVDLNDRTQVEAQIRNEAFWLGTPESFWEKLAVGSKQRPEDFQEEKCREVLEDIRTRRGGHDDRAELRTLFGLPPGYRFDLYDLIDITNGFITNSQLVEQEARQSSAASQIPTSEVPIQELINQGDKDDSTPRRWQRFRGSLNPLGGATMATQITTPEEPEAVQVEEVETPVASEGLTGGLREAFQKAQQEQAREDKTGNNDKRAQRRQKRDEQIRRARELRRKYSGG
ncbi:MAG: hypothetical protein HYW33_00550 [Candidatus Blackburnbacteria bacterium]|nr:hypothetical protein [Candidatus Blackburnbacteria bacterium]